jgi:Na+:H+ antiporter, NhaA family
MHPASASIRRFNHMASKLQYILHGDAGAGLLLMAAAILAMGLANSNAHDAMHHLWHGVWRWTPIAALPTLHSWVDQTLMAVFFFTVGLEIKREALIGELAHPRQRRLPVVAALAGMACPAVVYLAVIWWGSSGDPAALLRGWAIPAATDIAFAVGILGLVGKGLPPSLRLFLLSVAIVDDLGAVLIIALVYTAHISYAWLAMAAVVMALMAALNYWGVKRASISLAGAYLPLAVALWFCVLHSGVHASVAGVLAALTIPLSLDAKGDSLLLRLEHALGPWCAYAILPLFGLANAGVALTGSGWAQLGQNPALAVGLGLVVGKVVGIFAALWLCDKTGYAPRPSGASWLQLLGISLLAGIGFTMSLFITALAFPHSEALANGARLGILAGSLLSALMGFATLRMARGAG